MISLRITALTFAAVLGHGERHSVGDAGRCARVGSEASCQRCARGAVGVRSLPLLVDARTLLGRTLLGWSVLGTPPLLASLGLASLLVIFAEEAAPTGDPGRWSR